MKLLRIALIYLAACAWAAVVNAQTVYRCGSVYSQSPCAEGKALDVDDTRTTQQGEQTRTAVQRDAAAAKALEVDRLKQEAQAPAAYIPSAAVKEPAIEEKTQLKKSKKPAHFTAIAPRKPGDPPPKKKNKGKKNPDKKN